MLLELLVSSLILALLGIALSRAFSHEIKLQGILRDQERALFEAENKFSEILTTLKKGFDPAQLDSYKLQGTFDSLPLSHWDVSLSAVEGFSSFYKISLLVTGLKGGREINLTRWMPKDLSPEKMNTEDSVPDEE